MRRFFYSKYFIVLSFGFLMCCSVAVLGASWRQVWEAPIPAARSLTSDARPLCGGMPCTHLREAIDCHRDACPFVHQVGMELRDEAGKPLTLRGVNLGGWLHWEGWIWGGGFNSETVIRRQLQDRVGQRQFEEFERQIYQTYMTEADFARIAELGFNVVRIPINHRLLEDDVAPFTYKADGWFVLDRALDWAAKYDLYVILTLHAAPGGQSPLFTADPDGQLLWEDEENKARTIALWYEIANRYRHRPEIAGYDLLNEPDAPSDDALIFLYDDIVTAIRTADPTRMIIIEGADYGRRFDLFSDPISFNQMYSFHMYTWFEDNRVELLQNYHRISVDHQIPMWNGEFGENEYDMISSTVTLFEDPTYELVGWAFWTWKKAPNRYPYLLGHEPDAEWQTLIDWIEWPYWPRTLPTEDESILATSRFLEAADSQYYMEDPLMIEILTAQIDASTVRGLETK